MIKNIVIAQLKAVGFLSYVVAVFIGFRQIVEVSGVQFSYEATNLTAFILTSVFAGLTTYFLVTES